jgi:ribosomal protein S18 acetylase RimI-like enzyme
MLKITRVTEIDDELVQAFHRLLPQLSATAVPPDKEELEEMTRSGSCVIFIASDSEMKMIIGSLTLILVHSPTGKRAWIEDVVVDQEQRGKGIGEALSRAAIQHAREWDAVSVNLTSRPERQAANRLYQRIGFELRQTNIYRMKLS